MSTCLVSSAIELYNNLNYFIDHFLVYDIMTITILWNLKANNKNACIQYVMMFMQKRHI